MKIALYEGLTSRARTKYVMEATEYMEESDDYIRVSNIVVADFHEFPDDMVIPRKVEALRAEKTQQMAEYDERISKLLAITYNPEPELFSEASSGLEGVEEGS